MGGHGEGGIYEREAGCGIRSRLAQGGETRRSGAEIIGVTELSKRFDRRLGIAISISVRE